MAADLEMVLDRRRSFVGTVGGSIDGDLCLHSSSSRTKHLLKGSINVSRAPGR